MKPSEDILQFIPVAVLIFDAQGRFCYANEAACQLFNLDCQKAQGEMYHLLLPDLNMANCSPGPDPQVKDFPGKPSGAPERRQNCLDPKKPETLLPQLSLPGNNSHEERVVLLVEDMHDNRNLAGRVLEEERLMGVTEISNTMAHKLNQYLQVIMGYISLMTLEMDTEHQCYDYLKRFWSNWKIFVLPRICCQISIAMPLLSDRTAAGCSIWTWLPMSRLALISSSRPVASARLADGYLCPNAAHHKFFWKSGR